MSTSSGGGSAWLQKVRVLPKQYDLLLPTSYTP
jgi:hypothetical protein